MTLSEFRARFPEFRAASDTLVESVIAEATLEVAPETFGDLTATAIGYLTAHRLSTSAMGKDQRLVDKENETIHWKNYQHIVRMKTPHFIGT